MADCENCKNNWGIINVGVKEYHNLCDKCLKYKKEFYVYCLKCKSTTDTKDTKHILSSNNKHMIKGTCVDCGRNKCQFGGKLLSSELAEELHKPVIKKFPKRKVIVYGVDKIWAADLIDMRKYSKQNKHYKYLLSVIDIFSKYAWVIPLKTKTGLEVSGAFRLIFKMGRKPEKLWVDKGTEFYNRIMKDLLVKENTELYSTQNEEKSCIIERFNRTLKEKISKYFTAYNTTKYYDVLSQIVDEYNNTFHNTIKMKPVEGSKKENEEIIYSTAFQDKLCDKKPKFKVNDRVRITKFKKQFEKGYSSRWTNEVFIIDKVIQTNPITYKIKDENNEPIIGSFYENELQKSKF